MNPVIGLVFCAASCGICIVGMAIPYWLFEERGDGQFYFGLWRKCDTSPVTTSCENISDEGLPKWFIAVRVMEVLGVLISAGAVLLALIKTIYMKQNSALIMFAGVLVVVAGWYNENNATCKTDERTTKQSDRQTDSRKTSESSKTNS